MKQPQIKKVFTIETDKDWTDIQNSDLIGYFNSLGLYETVYKNRVIFKRNAHKANDFIKTGTKRDFLEIIRLAEVKLIETGKYQIKLEVSISLNYLIILSIGLGISYFLGMILFINEIGLTTFIISELIIVALTFLAGYLNISSKLNILIYKYLK